MTGERDDGGPLGLSTKLVIGVYVAAIVGGLLAGCWLYGPW
jgi:hypothetical protein